MLRCGDRDGQPSLLPPPRPVDESVAALSAEDAASLSEEQNTGITIAEIEQIQAESKSSGGKMRGGSSRDNLEQGRKKVDKKGLETTESTENLELMKEEVRI